MIVGLVICALIPALRSVKEKAGRIHCVSRNKQIGTAYRVFASDNGDRYPLQTTNSLHIFQPGGSGSAAGAVVSTSAQPWQVFQSMWNELQTPKVLLCPMDRARSSANRVTDFNGLAGASGTLTTASIGHPANRDLAVSYVPQALADESRPIGVLNVGRSINFATVASAAATVGAASGTRFVVNSSAGATAGFWVGGPGYLFHRLVGNLSFADGSVQQVTSAELQNSLSNAGAHYGWGTATSNGFGASVFLMP